MRVQPLLFSNAWRGILRMRYRSLAVCLIAASGFAMYVGVYSAIENLFLKRNLEYEKGNLADLELRFAPDTERNIPGFGDIQGVLAADSRLVFPGHLTLKDGQPLAAVLISVDPERQTPINRLTIVQGRDLDPAAPREVVIERHLAASHGYEIGDEFDLTIGRERYHVRIRGIALSPEYLIAPANPSIFVPTKSSLGVVFAPEELLRERLGFTLVNSLLFTFEEGVGPESVRQRLVERAATRLSIDQSIPLTEQFSYQFLKFDLNAFKIFLPAVVIVFSLTAFLVILFLMYQWIIRERQEIGTLMSLGYQKSDLSFAYLYPALLIGAGGTLIGNALSFITLYGFSVNYAEAIGFPRPDMGIALRYVAWGSVGVLATVAAAVTWPQTVLLNLTPLEAVRESDRLPGSRLGRLAALVGHLRGPLWLRFAIRNLLRNKAVSLMTIVAVALGLGLTISFFVCLTSFNTTAIQSIEHDRWTALVGFFTPVWEETVGEFDRIEGVKQWVPYVRGTVQLSGKDDKSNIPVIGIPSEPKMRTLTILRGRDLQPGDKRVVVLERKLVAEQGLRVGDSVVLLSRGREYEARLVGVLSGALPNESYVPIEFARELLDLKGRSSGLFLVTDGVPEVMKRRLYAMDDVVRVTFKGEVVDELLEASREVEVILHIAAAFSVCVAILFVFSSFAFTILQRKAEYGMLRIIGFGDGTLVAMIIAEVMVLGVVLALLAVPVGYGFAVFLNLKLSEAWFAVRTVTHGSDFMAILLPAMVFLPVAAWPAIRVVLRESLPQVLRERRFG